MNKRSIGILLLLPAITGIAYIIMKALRENPHTITIVGFAAIIGVILLLD